MNADNGVDIEVGGTLVAFFSKADLAAYLRSPDLAQRCIYAAKQGFEGWVQIVRGGPDLLITAASARRAAQRIAGGEMPPEYESKKRAREVAQGRNALKS